jgi:hypothetical protein
MSRCQDQWRRGGDTTVGVTAKCSDPNQFYSLTYVFYSSDPARSLLPGGSFDSTELAAGVAWQVPEGYRCLFEILTTGNKAIDTKIDLNGEAAECHAGFHCQGQCIPTGPAGLAGRWAVTAMVSQ